MLRLFAILLVVQIAFSNCFEIQPKILRGQISDARDVPFMVAMKTIHFGSPGTCSGVLISDRWILTAGHCVKPEVERYAFFGNHQNGSFEGAVKYTGDYNHIHPRYHTDPLAYDIGLIELPAPIPLSEKIQPIDMPQRCVNIDAAGLRLIGVGAGHAYAGQQYEGYEGTYETNLRQAIFTTFARADYDDVIERCYGGDKTSILVTESKKCTAGGDSGGPLILEEDGTFVGVHYGKCNIGLNPPHMSMKLSHFFGWISEKTGLSLPECSDNSLFQSLSV